jgi:hypothetical protein
MDIQAGICGGPGQPRRTQMIERAEEISSASVGLTIAEGKALLASLQAQIVTEQIHRHVASMKSCPQCGKALRTKGHYQSTLRLSAFQNSVLPHFW